MLRLDRKGIEPGRRFGKVVILSQSASRNGRRMWECQCDCGKLTVIRAELLRSGRTKSCGCLRYETRNATHGMSKLPEYRVWKSMMTRCFNPHTERFKNYGGRGITICAEWKSFPNFYRDMGRRPSPHHSIDRINNSGDYEPGNCRWATTVQQARNGRCTRIITYAGVSACLTEWAERLGMRMQVLHHRLSRGWTVRRALTTPLARLRDRVQGRYAPHS